MASFDFIDASAKGYAFVWQQRPYLMRLAVIPIALKIVLYWGIVALGWEADLLRQGLVLFPSYLAEGWLIGLAIRMALYNEFYDIQFTGNPQLDEVRVKERFRALKACMVIYALVKLMSAFIVGLGMQFSPDGTAAAPDSMPAPGYDMFFVSVILIAFMVWAFRFFWLYIPVCMGLPLMTFLRRIHPFFISLYMVALWLLCFVPIGFVMVTISQMLVSVFPIIDGEPGRGYFYALGAIQSVFEILIAMVSSVAMAYAFQHYLFGEDAQR